MPLVFSNPRLFPEPKASDALVSHVDLLPTLASVIDAPDAARADWQGVDYSALLRLHVRDPSAPPLHIQDDIIFTYDDLRCAQNVIQLVPPPNRIVSIREARYKLARYYATTTATTSNQTSGRCTTWTTTPRSESTWPSPAPA